MQGILNWVKNKKNIPIIAVVLVVIVVGAAAAYFYTHKDMTAATTAPATAPTTAPTTAPADKPSAPAAGNTAAAPSTAATAPAAPAAEAPKPETVAAAPSLPMPLFPYRNDPFLPLAEKPTREQAIEMMVPSASKVRLAPLWVSKPEPIVAEVTAGPQPNRRLAGVLWGDKVSAILETGTSVDVVRPGSVLDRGNSLVRVERIEPTSLTLVTLDTAKPIEIKVNLSSAPSRPKPAVESTGGRPAPGGGGGVPNLTILNEEKPE